MDEKIFEDIIALITKQTGIIPRESHKSGIQNFISKRCTELNLPGMREYYDYLKIEPNEFSAFINGATVNETYFFREEAQFALLQEKIFPSFYPKVGNAINPLRIWSAAASSGEEIYSLHLLASSMGIKTQCIASDINTAVLEKCENGVYKSNSVRSLDGAKFHPLLSPYKEDETISFPRDLSTKIERRQINLSKSESHFPPNIHIVFVRNVFIYFTLEMRKTILEKIVKDSLADGGYLFVSMNEIASIDSSIIPPELEKCCDGKVFYFRKKSKS